MTTTPKQISNPFSNGGGGVIFESRVQAAFTALMLAKGVCPCLPSWPIYKVKFQGKYSEYETDDLIVFVRHPSSDRQAKLIAQIKRAPSITKADSEFAEAIQSAWSDFENANVFQYGYDAIALITGPLTATDTYDVRDMLEIARGSQDSADFFQKVRLANFSSEGKQAKLEVFQHLLKKANHGVAPGDDSTWKFLKSFHLLGYDLDIRAGVTVSLLQSLIGTSACEDVEKVWLKIVNEVQSWNPRAGVMTFENLPRELLDCFQIKLPPQMPVAAIAPIHEIIAAVLFGAWDENADGDTEAIERFTGMPFATWQDKIRDIWLTSPNTFKQQDGRWRISDRQALWDREGARVSDAQIDKFEQIAVTVLREKDTALELAPDERLTAGFRGNKRVYSARLRKGIAETLALLGARSASLSTCSHGKAEGTASKAVREILSAADWNLWASLNDVLPLLAEAAPEAFLEAIETVNNSGTGTFANVFAQETPGIMGATYMTGLLWGLETLAWASDYLVPVCRILSDLAAADPGGNWSNRPSNSLAAILLPWLPQTCADTEKRHAAARVVIKRQPEVGWHLLLSLLPELHSISPGTHHPIWQSFIPETWKNEVLQSQYWTDVLAYSQFALELAKNSAGRLVRLIEHYFRLPTDFRISLRKTLTSDDVLGFKESDRFELWTALGSLSRNHRKFADSDNWKVPEADLDELDKIADQLSPTAPEVRHKRLFSGVDADLYETRGNWEQERQKLSVRRQEAIREILAAGGISLLIKFASDASAPRQVGLVFGSLPDIAQDSQIIPILLEADSESLLKFAGGYVWGRLKSGGWGWVDSLKIEEWSSKSKCRFFVFLPFCEETWGRVQQFLGSKEDEYWRTVSANPHECSSGIEMALEKLICYGKADVAVHCMHLMDEKRNINPGLVFQALDALNSSHDIDAYAIGELITKLQTDASQNEDALRRLEWKFLPLLGEFRNGQPISLSRWMAEEPSFFCDVIRTVYRSTKDEDKTEPSEDLKRRAEKASHLLMEWRMPPGTRRDGTFDSESLALWVNSVKKRCIESGHWEIAANQIGQVLFYAPHTANGLWIDPVCEVLDANDNVQMRSGLTMEIFNSRGGFTYTTGKQESELAEYWEDKASQAENKGFSLLGQELRKLAKSYHSDAEYEAKHNPYESI